MKGRLKVAIAIVVLALCSAQFCEARLGETVRECDARYGMPSGISSNDVGCLMRYYYKKGYSIGAVFTSAWAPGASSICNSILIGHPNQLPILLSETQYFLDRNAGSSSWSVVQGSVSNSSVAWMRADRRAVGALLTNGILCLSTSDKPVERETSPVEPVETVGVADPDCIEAQLSNRLTGEDRLLNAGSDGDTRLVSIAVRDNLTLGMVERGWWYDAWTVAQVVFDNEPAMMRVRVVGIFGVQNAYGNTVRRAVGTMIMDRATYQKINKNTFDATKLPVICDAEYELPE